MTVSPAQAAKRALVVVLKALATAYSLVLTVKRDSPDEVVNAAARKVLKSCHPDKGGRAEDAQRLNAARETWQEALRGPGRPARAAAGSGPGREVQRHNAAAPPSGSRTGTVAIVEEGSERREFRIQSKGVLLTYMGFEDIAQWTRFVAFVRGQLKPWQVNHWCATLEQCETGKLHAHLMLQFTTAAERTSRSFAFEEIIPRADPNDLLGEGWCKKKLQDSLNRAFFYVWADKIGTQRDTRGDICVAGNYMPCWTTSRFRYAVPGRWPEKLWKARKLSDSVYEEYLFETKDGVISRKRNLDACREHAEARSDEAEISDRVQRIRQNLDLCPPFPPVPAAVAWLTLFALDAVRYPILVVLGPSLSGKTEWAKTLFKKPHELKIGWLEQFPDAMRRFSKKINDGLILDDVRDLEFVVRHQDKLQGKYDHRAEFGTTPGGTCAFSRDMFATPVVVTINYTTKNLHYLETNDFLGNTGNRTVVTFPLSVAPPVTRAVLPVVQ
jgi:hypothetical protein